jgi:hypothetical protein
VTEPAGQDCDGVSKPPNVGNWPEAAVRGSAARCNGGISGRSGDVASTAAPDREQKSQLCGMAAVASQIFGVAKHILRRLGNGSVEPFPTIVQLSQNLEPYPFARRLTGIDRLLAGHGDASRALRPVGQQPGEPRTSLPSRAASLHLSFDIFLRPVAACHWYSATRGRVSVRLFSRPSRGSVWRTKTSRAPAPDSAHAVEARGVT